MIQMSKKVAKNLINPIYMVDGSKGGVGKSIVCMALLDYLQAIGMSFLFIETDGTNPDVYKCYGEAGTAVTLNLDIDDGWIDLVDLCEQHQDKVVVINTGARNSDGVKKYGKTLLNILGDLERSLVTLWVINRDLDSVNLLKKYMDTMQDTVIHVIRNEKEGDESKFAIYNGSEVRKTVELTGKTLNFNRLADRAASLMYNDRKAIKAALESAPLGLKAELTRWRNENQKIFAQIIKS